MATSSWAQLRQQARTLESQTDSLFHSYSQFSTLSKLPPKPTTEELETESKLEAILNKRATVIGQLTRLLDSEAALTSSAVKQNNLSLLREKLADHQRGLQRLRSQLADARNRANLLSHVRGDIESHHRGQRSSGGATAAEDEGDYMLGEQARLDRSNAAASGVLSQAYAIHSSFAHQNETLASINRRINMAANRVPGLNSLISRISSRKRRDSILVGVFIAMCCLVFWWFL